MHRRSILIIVATAIVALAVSVGVAAAAAHFMSASSTVADSGALVVSFDESGLGNGDINYTLTADATATYACINGGGNHPRAANKETVNGDVSGGGTFQAKNGRVKASVSAGPISAGDFSCPSGQALVLASVSYSNIVLTDTTNNVSVNLGSTSRTFFNV